ncbi:hypothetical protein AX16_006071 [Volvariella volvacea WC 439]|nr:hypothetical protein AX16_006071 [Volvariella volvacea WC 439]
MLLASLFILLLARTLAHPVAPPIDTPVPPSSRALNALVAVSDCIRDPTRIRSEWELVWNCVGTIFICTYAAYHPNMPRRGISKSERMWQRVISCLYALVAPEAMILWALRQRFVASRIAAQYRGYGWTMAHGFFVQMGGFVCVDKNGHNVVTINMNGDVILQGREWQATKIIFPAVSREEIQDKSKGDLLSKTIFVVQTSWFVTQCVARLAQQLVVTDLEFVTLAFVLVNLTVYFIWWNKPSNAEYPIFFRRDGTRSNGLPQTAGDSLGVQEQYRGLWLGWMWGMTKLDKGIWQGARQKICMQSLLKVVGRWLFMKPFETFFFPLSPQTEDTAEYYSGPVSIKERRIVACLLSLVGILFGGIHLSRWDHPFPTIWEQTTWRISSLVVTFEPVALASFLVLQDLVEKWPDGVLSAVMGLIMPIMAFVAAFIGPLAYTLARAILMVLPLFALRNLPPAAFENVKWSHYLPHI